MSPFAKPHHLHSRRSFLANAALTAASVSVAPRIAHSSSARSGTITGHQTLPGHLTPGLALSVDGRTTFLPTPYVPSALAMHPALPVLYIASTGPDPGLLTAHSFDPLNRTLHPLSQQPLSLAATRPCAVEVAPDARSLLTLDSFGLINVHPLLPNGAIGPIEHTCRLTGSPAVHGSLSRPTALLLHRGGDLALIADPACRRIVRIALAGQAAPTPLPSIEFPEGFHPAGIALHPRHDLLAVASASSSSIALLSLSDQLAHGPAAPAALHVLPSSHLPNAVQFSPDGTQLVVSAAASSRHFSHTYRRVGTQLLHVACRPISPPPPSTSRLTFAI